MNVGAAASFSECAVTKVASRSMTNGSAAEASWSGASRPAAAHTLARADALAVSIAASAVGASAANVAMARETVGSDATDP